MISEEAAEAALNYLKGSDAGAAKAKAYYALLDDQKKTVLADQKIKADGSSAAEKAAIAEASEEYKTHINKLHDAIYDHEITRNKRKSAELQIEMWRSQNANMRKGNI